jgi:chemotaxis regulatin CheY-phosphate phosphatase CheZ
VLGILIFVTDVSALAQHLFQHWEQYFHNHMEEQDFHIFAKDTINKLSDLISESSQNEEFHDDDEGEL